ncbi:MAG TPA: hypothetical protein VMU09_02955 [Acidimicrobiales bacterium]|nr:hypothetical protein [Acidimicrobiales bacterium]
MLDFWTSIPLMALAALVTLTLLVGLSVADQRRSEPVPVRLEDRGRPSRRPPPPAPRPLG